MALGLAGVLAVGVAGLALLGAPGWIIAVVAAVIVLSLGIGTASLLELDRFLGTVGLMRGGGAAGRLGAGGAPPTPRGRGGGGAGGAQRPDRRLGCLRA
ncbi:MAG: hypothetical protein IPK28_14515 [Devosia sp.]|nr:hypothetical protein [Devosia sp.]